MRLLTLVTLVAAGCAHAPAPQKPYAASPQWKDGQFQNPSEWPKKASATNALKWRLTPRDGHPAPVQAPYRSNDGAELRDNAGNRVSLTWIGHATVLVQSGGLNILTDPHFGQDTGGLFRRLAPPGVALKDLPPIDVVVISHNHRDHLDEDSVKALHARFGDRVTFVVPLGLGPWFHARKITNVIELDWWADTDVTAHGDTARVTLVPAQHWSQRGSRDRNRSLWGGYVLDAGGRRFYFAGDTGYPAAFGEIGRRFPGIDCAMLPIGAYAPRWFMHPQHMSPEEAAQAFRELGARLLLPIHWATFKLTDEPIDEPPRLLYTAMGKLANAILFLPIGGTFWATPRSEQAMQAEQPATSDPPPDRASD